MKSRATSKFWRMYAELPDETRRQAREAYRYFRDDPGHPGLDFKKVHPSKPIWSVRVDYDYRAVAVLEGDTAVWFWIGSHSSYDKLLSRL